MADDQFKQPLQGCCLSMCSPDEITFRQRERLVHVMEFRPACRTSSAGNQQYFVKQFSRSSAGREIKSSDVRPLPILVRTLHYLLSSSYGRRDCPEWRVHEFISDRIRALRQDLAVQGLLETLPAAPLLAACTRYHALQQYRLCERPTQEFDSFLNMKHLQEILTALIRLYLDQDSCPARQELAHFSFDLDNEEEEFFPSSAGTDTDVCSGTEDSNRLEDDTDVVSSLLSGVADIQLAPEDDGAANNEDDAERPEQHQCQSVTTKDKKNRENKVLGEQVKEDSRECDAVRWTNVRASEHEGNVNLSASASCSKSVPTESSAALHCSTEREEMECLHALLHCCNGEALQHSLQLPPVLRNGPVLVRVLPALLDYHSTGNFTPLIRLLPLLPTLLSITLYLSLPRIQRHALQVLAAGHSSCNTRYPLEDLVVQLMLPDVDAACSICQHYGLKITGDNNQYVAFHRRDFNLDAPVLPLRRAPWLDEKLVDNTSLLLPRPLILATAALASL